MANKNYKEEIDLYRKISDIRSELKPLRVSGFQFKYFKKFLKEDKKNFYLIIFLIFLITLFEILIPVFLDIVLNRSIFLLRFEDFYNGLFILIVLIFLYLLFNYLSITKQRKLFLDFINQLREYWVNYYLSKNKIDLSKKEIGRLYVKITYHFSLLLTGLTNTIFNFFQWLFLSIGILVAATIIDPVILIISIISIIISLLIIYIGYIISVYYIGHDQTLYSKILQFVSDSVHDFQIIKNSNKKVGVLNNLKTMVEIDTFFRVRREILLNFGQKIIFSILIVVSALSYISVIYFPIFSFLSDSNSIIFIIIFILLARLMYLSLNIGLFYFPLKLGLYLTVPENEIFKSKGFYNINKIDFRSNKFRYSKNLPYRKNINYKFEKGNKYLIIGESGSGKSHLANIINGTVSKKEGSEWVIIINEKVRISLNGWCKASKKIYFINPHSNITTHNSIYNIIENGTDKKINTIDKIKNEFEQYSDKKSLNFLFGHNKFIGKSNEIQNYSFNENVIIQILQSIINKPDIVIIDNLWIEMNNPAINEVLDIMYEKLNKSIIIAFSNNENVNFNYDKKYTI